MSTENNQMHEVFNWRSLSRFTLLGGALSVPATLAAIHWIDLPLALWIHRQGLDGHAWMRFFLDTPIVVTPLLMLYAIAYTLRRRRSVGSRRERDWFLLSVTLLCALQVKSVLKLAFGRTWPRAVANFSVGTDSSSQQSGNDLISSAGYINDGLHAFRFFHGAEKQFAAFPSGSTVSLVALVIPLMAMYPRFRWPLAIFSATSMAMFILTNTHFLGDVIAGLYVGAFCGGVCLAIRNDHLVLGR